MYYNNILDITNVLCHALKPNDTNLLLIFQCIYKDVMKTDILNTFIIYIIYPTNILYLSLYIL